MSGICYYAVMKCTDWVVVYTGVVGKFHVYVIESSDQNRNSNDAHCDQCGVYDVPFNQLVQLGLQVCQTIFR